MPTITLKFQHKLRLIQIPSATPTLTMTAMELPANNGQITIHLPMGIQEMDLGAVPDVRQHQIADAQTRLKVFVKLIPAVNGLWDKAVGVRNLFFKRNLYL